MKSGGGKVEGRGLVGAGGFGDAMLWWDVERDARCVYRVDTPCCL